MMKFLWRRFLADKVAASVRERSGLMASREQEFLALSARLARAEDLVARLEQRDIEQARRLDEQRASVAAEITASKMDILALARRNLHVPNPGIHPAAGTDFMVDNTCSARDFPHPEFSTICQELSVPPVSTARSGSGCTSSTSFVVAA